LDKKRALIVGSTGKLGTAINSILENYFELDYCYKVEFENSNKTKGILYCLISKTSFDLSDYKIIINCSWVAGVSHLSLKQNIEICNLLLSNNSNGIFIYFSSIDVYGKNNIDTYECEPRTIFAINKLRVERSILNTETKRAKIILRVGNYISNEQLECDVSNTNFLLSLNRHKDSNIVSPDVLVNKICQFAIESYQSNQLILDNCVNSPNYTWGEIVDSINSDSINPNKKSDVLIQNSGGVIPFFFKYVSKSGNLSVNFSFLKIKVLLIMILSRFVKKSTNQHLKSQSDSVSFSRVYQDYTLR